MLPSMTTVLLDITTSSKSIGGRFNSYFETSYLFIKIIVVLKFDHL